MTDHRFHKHTHTVEHATVEQFARWFCDRGDPLFNNTRCVTRWSTLLIRIRYYGRIKRGPNRRPIYSANTGLHTRWLMFETSQRDAFYDAWKAMESVYGRGSAPHPVVWGWAQDAPPDLLVSWKGETNKPLPFSSPFSTPRRNISDNIWKRDGGRNVWVSFN